jgi:hypothetical protein
MKLFINLLTLFLFSLLAGCAGTKQVTVHNSERPIIIDGSLSDWDTGASSLNDSDEIRYFATKQGNYLYVFVDVRSIYKDQSIRQMGMTVYLSNSEDNRRNVGIGFPPGTFNLLRQYPNSFNEFTTDLEWSRKPENIEFMTELSKELFSRVMIVERFDGGSRPEYGFAELSQVEIDGFEIATDTDRRLLSLEMKIPIDGSSLYNVRNEDLWIGFAIEPPVFRFRDDNQTMSPRQQASVYGYGYGQRAPRQSARRTVPTQEDWFILRLR